MTKTGRKTVRESFREEFFNLLKNYNKKGLSSIDLQIGTEQALEKLRLEVLYQELVDQETDN